MESELPVQGFAASGLRIDLRQTILLAMVGISLKTIALLFYPFFDSIRRFPSPSAGIWRGLFVPQNLIPLLVSIARPLALAVFLLCLYLNLGDPAHARNRKTAAWLAIGCLAASVLSTLVMTLRMQAFLAGNAALLEGRVGMGTQWLLAGLQSIAPGVTAILLLYPFALEDRPLEKRWTQRLAGLLCVFELMLGAWTCYSLLSGIVFTAGQSAGAIPPALDAPREIGSWLLMVVQLPVVAFASGSMALMLYLISHGERTRRARES